MTRAELFTLPLAMAALLLAGCDPGTSLTKPETSAAATLASQPTAPAGTPEEVALDARYKNIEQGIYAIRGEFYNGRYNGPLPLSEVLKRLQKAREELRQVLHAYNALPDSKKTNREIGMRFLTLGKMGIASVDSSILAAEQQLRRTPTNSATR